MASPKSATRGRPRSFDENVALEKAMVVFWNKGYEGAAVSDLIEAMGITPPSLYAAFGNKEGLFLRAIEHYTAGPAGYVRTALDAPTCREVAERRLYGTVQQMCETSCPSCCLVAQTAARFSGESNEIGKAVLTIANKMQQAYADRFARGVAEGDLPEDADPMALARYIDAMSQGIVIQASFGVDRDGLNKLVEIALQQWPV